MCVLKNGRVYAHQIRIDLVLDYSQRASSRVARIVGLLFGEHGEVLHFCNNHVRVRV